MWNEREIPIAYLITFRSYGTWLHGDNRGSIDRFNNKYKAPLISPNKSWSDYNLKNLKNEICILNAEQRKCIEESIIETCRFRNWTLHALNVRTNHIHCVVSIGDRKPETALNAFKANATREMRSQKLWSSEKSPWSDKGSRRYLWTERSFALAVEYVLYGQGEDLPEFD